MKIESIHAHAIEIPFKRSFSHAAANRVRSSAVVVRVQTLKGASGYGECTPRKYVTGESMESVLEELLRCFHLLKQETFEDIWEIENHATIAAASLSVRCVLELAILDGMAHELGCSLFNLLGPVKKDEIRYSAVIESINGESLERLLLKMTSFKFKQAKVKVTRDERQDLERIQMTRKILGEEVELRVDANGCWDLEESRYRIKDLATQGIRSIEQPLPKGMEANLKKLTTEFGHAIQIMADESACGLKEAKILIDRSAVNAINLKVSKHGGLLPALTLSQYARERGVSCQLGCFVGETSILGAAGLMLAGLTGDLVAHEGLTASFLLDHDLTAESLSFGVGGIMSTKKLYERPGLGVEVNPNKLPQM